MSGSMYLVRGEELIEMTDQPYGLESHLQEWIAQHPPLLAGDQMNSENPRRWILIGRELAIPSELDGSGRWPIDHLFIDQDAIPTIVEAKRSSNPEIRRQVVGQIIDYAANAVRYLPISLIRSYFEATCMERKTESSQKLSHLLGSDADIEQFWGLVESNLQAGRIRLVFVGNIIPPELRRAVEYLNDQMRDAEVLAVEVKQFKGKGVTTLVPRVIGQTVQTQERKARGTRSNRPWDEELFLEELERRHSSIYVDVARKILDWLKTQDVEMKWGKGQKEGSVYLKLQHDEKEYVLFSLWTWYGVLHFDYSRMLRNPPLAEEKIRVALVNRLRAIPALNLHPAASGSETCQFNKLADQKVWQAFVDTFDWYFEQIRAP